MGAHLLHSFPCKNCGTEFLTRPYNYNRGFRIYCGKACYNATRPKGFGKSTTTDYERKIASQQRNPVQTAARKILDSAMRRKGSIRWPCAVCNDKKTEGHHYDYNKALDVFWLCRAHHIEAHDGTLRLPMWDEPEVPPKGWPRGRSSRCRPRAKPIP